MHLFFKNRRWVAACAVIVLILLCVPAASAVAEDESNNTYATANTTINDADNTGTMSSATDVDWWKVTFNQDGWANYWLGNIKSGNDFDLALYDSNGTTLLESSENSSNSQELIRYNVIKNRTYYIKITAYIVNASTAKTYKFRAKVYNTEIGKLFVNNPVLYGETEDDGYNSVATATASLPLLWDMGYDAGQYINNSANSGYSTLPNVNLFLFNHHGGPGMLEFRVNSGEKSYIVADAASDYYLTSADREIADLSSMSSINLAIYCGCNTAQYSSTYGDLVEETLEKGAKCAIAWYDKVYENDSNRWFELFFSYCGQGKTILQALELTDEAMEEEGWSKWVEMSNWYTGDSDVSQKIG